MLPHVSHISVGVSDLHRSEVFYRIVGFDKVIERSSAQNVGLRYVVLEHTPSRPSEQNPALLLIQVPPSAPADQSRHAHLPGIARMALSVPDLAVAMRRMQSQDGFTHFITEPVVDLIKGSSVHTALVAAIDPDGTLVEFVENPRPAPFFIHVNINVINYDEGLALFRGIGFEMVHDLGYVDNAFYKALRIPDPGLARHASLLKLPGDRSFMLDLIEWAEPRTEGQALTWNDDLCFGMVSISVSTGRDLFEEQARLLDCSGIWRGRCSDVCLCVTRPVVGKCDALTLRTVEGTLVDLVRPTVQRNSML